MNLLDHFPERSSIPWVAQMNFLEKGRISVEERKNDGQELDGQREVQVGG